MNHFMYQDPMMTPNDDECAYDESTHQWTHDAGSGREMLWHHPYEMDLTDNYNMRPQAPHQRHQPMVSRPPAPRYPPMRTIRRAQGYPEDRMGLAPYPRSVGPQIMRPRPMGPPSMMSHSMYPSTGYSYGARSPVLKQLHPSNEQLRSLPEMHTGMHPGMSARQQFAAPPAYVGSPSVKMVSPDIYAAPATTSKAGRMAELPKSQFEINKPNPPVKRPNKGGSTTSSSSPKKRVVDFKVSPGKAKTVAISTTKENISADSTDTESKPRNKRVRFVSASVVDVLRWRKNCVFSAADKANLVIEIVGTVFDVSGIQPIKISIHSQDTIVGLFWETDFRLDRNVILPGCLVRAVLRIPGEDKDFHFIKVTPLEGPPGIENAFRRISYVTTTALEQSLNKS